MRGAVSDDAALIVYLLVLWIAAVGILAPPSSRSPVCIWAKRLAAVTFVALVIDSMRMTGAS